ncbi:MAG: DeoR/GlpR transcriptional regulator [Clostridia bacterium]|nr:DeoR/GlpR transcriptional regulator [Clostridia bacterium]
MLTPERQEAVLQLLRKTGSATVREMAKSLYVSEATVRRDLTEMETHGLLRRSHGGAVLIEHEGSEPSFFVRKEENIAEKRRLAKAVLPYLDEGSCFFLDSSSTVLALAAVWDAAHKTVITTGVDTAFLLSRKRDVQVVLPGGTLHYLAGAVWGALTLRQLEGFHADTFICSCGGISPEGGLYESVTEGEIKATMMRHSTRRILIADGSKLGRMRTYRFAGLSDFDMLVTDKRPSEEICRMCEENHVKLLFLS